ncbi:MAG TPA: methyltransferase domain-containing protein, partial [Tepidisphaeraceae bacterium]|nr:methyltransferase domain-containing protein [Tepidisphaeraceae bacterium]
MDNEQTQHQDSPAMNSRGWWEDYFREKWEANRGREQTRHFMRRLIESLPEAEVSFLSSRPTEVLDWGCALGEGVKALADQFPLARVAGLDFSATAIDSARRHYPDFEFLRTDDGHIPRHFDVIVTSNCLEHFERPLEVMERHLRSCHSVYAALVPYNEFPLCEYHRSQFGEESFPRRLGSFVRLASKVIDVDPSQWAGKQLLVVYGSESYLKERAVSDTRELERQKWERYYADAPLEQEDGDTRQFGEELVERLSQILPAGASILEAGCGAGWQGLALARSGRFRVTMMDFSEAALSQARRLFEREKVTADFLCADAFTPGEPEFDLVFNAGVLEHYTPDEQAALLRGMASRSRRFVLALVPNRLCYWYWLWRLQKSAGGAWPYGKEVPVADLSQVLSGAGLHFVGQKFMGVRWTEGFIRALWGMDEPLLEAALELHRSPLAPDAQRAYLVAGLGAVEAVGTQTFSGWTTAPFAEDRRTAEMSAALADALALRVGADVQLTRLRGLLDERVAATQRVLEEAAQEEVETVGLRRQVEALATEVSAAREEARAAREESAGLRQSSQKLSERAESLQSELRAAQQKREALRAALAAEQHARQLLESTLSGSYGHVVERVRELVHTVTPRGATVLVVSKGDPDLLRFDGRQGWHFPQAEGNQYAGHYPASSAEAVEHLEALRAKGANFIAFPNAAFWWLDHYREFKQYLDDKFVRVAGDERCVVYRLSTDTGGGSDGTRSETRLWSRMTNLLHGRRRSAGESRPILGGHQGNGAGSNGHQPALSSTTVVEPSVKPQKAAPMTRPTPVTAPNEFDVVCFPIIDWDFRFQRPQQLAACFGARGRRVFYVSQVFRPNGDPYELRERRPNVYEVSLRGPRQNVYKQAMTQRAAEILSDSLDALRRDLSIETSVSLVQLPFWWPLARRLRDAHGWPLAYDCMDHHAGFSTNGAGMLEQEEELLRRADLVVASSAGIEREVRRYNPNVSLVRNGCDYDHFAAPPYGPPPFPKKPGRPVIGYYGAIADWFDADLVADVAARRPEWDFVLVGSTHTADVARLSKLPNVTLSGERPYEQIPGWLAAFDVAILPFKRVPLTESTNPVKAYEIFAAGKPLVSVPLPEVQAMGNRVRLAADADNFERQIAEVFAGKDDPAAVEERRAFARSNTWEKRAAALEPMLLEAVRTYHGGGRAAEVPGLVSVVLPVYNQAGLLRESIESVLAQTYPHFELIVVNDGSTDGVERVLHEYAGHPKVRLLTQRNQNLPKALSNGFDFARGEYWTWTSADNLMHPDQLARMGEFLRGHPDAAMVYADYLAIDDRGQPLRDPSFRPHNRRSPESPEIHLPRSTTELNTVKDNFIGACFMYRASAGRV